MSHRFRKGVRGTLTVKTEIRGALPDIGKKLAELPTHCVASISHYMYFLPAGFHG
jgi:hypothetical protein